MAVADYAACEAFLESHRPRCERRLLIDAYLLGMNGVELPQPFSDAGHRLLATVIAGNRGVPMAVPATRTSASAFLEESIGRSELLASVRCGLEQSPDSSKLLAWRETAANHVAGLTSRQRQIMDLASLAARARISPQTSALPGAPLDTIPSLP